MNQTIGNRRILACLLLMLSIGCAKKNKSIPIDPTVKKYFSYGLGSYWIYFDSLSGQTDSFVIQNKRYSVTPTNNGDADIEWDDLGVYHNGQNQDSLSLTYQLRGNGIIVYYRTVPVLTFSYPFQPIGTNFSVPQDTVYYENFLDNYTLRGNNYADVAKIFHSSSLFGGYTDTFYVNKDVGLIKMILHHSASFSNNWNLLRQNILH